MDWPTTEGNYSKYVGGAGQEGTTKKVFCSRIAKEISSSDNSQTHSSEDAYKYISRLEKQFRNGLDWLNQTGQGLEEGQIKDYMKKRFPSFELLKPIMGEWPNAKPLLTNKDSEFLNDGSFNLNNDVKDNGSEFGIDDDNDDDDDDTYTT